MPRPQPMKKSPDCRQNRYATVKYDPASATWSVAAPACPDFKLTGLRPRLSIGGRWIALSASKGPSIGHVAEHSGRGIVVESELPNGLTVKMQAVLVPNKPAVLFDVELTNRSSATIALDTLHLLEFDRKCRFGEVGKLKVFSDSGGGWWAGVTDIAEKMPFSETVNAVGYSEMREQISLIPEDDRRLLNLDEKDLAGFHSSAGGISLLYDPTCKQSLMVGFATMRQATGHVTWRYSSKSGHLTGWAGTNFAGYGLQPGESIRSERLFFGLYPSPFTALEDFASVSGKLMKVEFPSRPIMGWCSWYAYRLKVTEAIVLDNARALKKNLPGYDFQYIQVDHGWQPGNICGDWMGTNERFPHGIEWLSTQVRKTGYQLGLWLGITNVLASAPVAKANPEILIQDRNGDPKSVGRWFWEPNDLIYSLDPTHPGTHAFLAKTLNYLRQAGCRYWKFDFLWSMAGNTQDYVYHNKKIVKGAGIYRRGLAQIAQLLKGDYLYWCSNPLMLGLGLGSTSMTACDIGNTGFSLARKVEGRIEDIAYFRRCATTIFSRYYLHKRLLMLNPDVVEVGGLGDYEEGKIRLTLVALSGGQVMLGDNLTELKARDWSLLEKCVPPYGEAARPVDLFDHTGPESYPHIWHLPVKTDWDSWDVVGLVNLTQTSEEIVVNFDSLQLVPGRPYLVFEFWSHRLLGVFTEEACVTLAPVTTQLLLIKAYREQPMVLSTDMHVTQGGVELQKVSWDVRRNRLQGIACRQKGSSGHIYIHVPSSYQAVKLPPGARIKNKVLALPVVFQQATCRWHVDFESLK